MVVASAFYFPSADQKTLIHVNQWTPLGEPPKRNGLDDWNPAAVERVRAALSAARAARRDEEKR